MTHGMHQGEQQLAAVRAGAGAQGAGLELWAAQQQPPWQLSSSTVQCLWHLVQAQPASLVGAGGSAGASDWLVGGLGGCSPSGLEGDPTTCMSAVNPLPAVFGSLCLHWSACRSTTWAN